MNMTALETAFPDFRPGFSYKITSPLGTLLGNDTIEYGQARWKDAHQQSGLEVDVFTAKHYFRARLATYSDPATVSVMPLIFSGVRWVEDDYTVTVGRNDVRLFRSSSTIGEKARSKTTGDPEAFLRWAVEHGVWETTRTPPGL